MGGQQGTRKTAPTPRPQTGRRIVEPPRNQPPQSSSTPPPVQQPTPVESFISGMGNIADPFFPQAQAQQDIFSTVLQSTCIATRANEEYYEDPLEAYVSLYACMT